MSSVGVAQASARGTLILFAGNLASTALLTVSIVLVARLLGPEGYGLYTLAVLVPGIVTLFVGFGVSSAVTRYVAYSLSTGDTARAVSMTRTAVLFTLVFGVTLSALDYALAPILLVDVLHRQVLVQYQAVSSLLVLGTATWQCATSAFIGWGSMVQLSVLTVIQAASKLVLQVGLILAGFGVFGAVTGHVASFIIVGFGGIAALYFVRFRTVPGGSNFVSDLRTMLRFGLPVFTGTVAQGLASQYATLILAAFVTNAVVGYYQAALNVTVPITVVATSVQNVLFRSFAELHGLQEDISLAFSYALRYVSLISTPISFFLLAAAPPLFDLFYGSAYAPGIVLLRLVALSYLPVALGLTVLPSFFTGVGKSRLAMVISVVEAVTLVAAATVLVALLGLSGEGIMVALLIGNSALVVSGLFLANRYLDVHVSAKPLVGIFLAGGLACVPVAALPAVGINGLEALAFDCVIYLTAYLTLVPLFAGLDYDDTVRLSIALDTMGPLKGIFRALVGYEQRILKLRGGS